MAARENAMFKMYGLTNGVYWFDTKNVAILTTDPRCLQMGKVRAVKFGVFVDSCLTIDDYCVGFGRQSDDKLFKSTEIRRALLNREEFEKLGWRHFKWRFEEDSEEPAVLEECGGYVVTDRKIMGLMDNVVRPFLPKFVRKASVKVVPSLQKMVNDRFLIGHSPVERFWGQFCNKYRFMRNCNKETNVQFVQLSVAIFFHLWNIEKDNLDSYFVNVLKPHQQVGKVGSLFLGHYRVNPRIRFSMTPRPQIQYGYLPRILTELWAYYEPRTTTLQNTGIFYEAPYERILPVKYMYKEYDENLLNYASIHL